jgi:hypothetical protein
MSKAKRQADPCQELLDAAAAVVDFAAQLHRSKLPVGRTSLSEAADWHELLERLYKAASGALCVGARDGVPNPQVWQCVNRLVDVCDELRWRVPVYKGQAPAEEKMKTLPDVPAHKGPERDRAIEAHMRAMDRWLPPTVRQLKAISYLAEMQQLYEDARRAILQLQLVAEAHPKNGGGGSARDSEGADTVWTRWASPSELARALGMHRNTLTNHIKKGRILCEKESTKNIRIPLERIPSDKQGRFTG